MNPDPWVDPSTAPAFPVTLDRNVYRGISIRDYFAGQALSGNIRSGERADGWQMLVAKDAYAIADAMLEVRDKE